MTVKVAPERSAKPQTQVTSLVVNFTEIGQPQVIRAPAHAIAIYGLS